MASHGCDAASLSDLRDDVATGKVRHQDGASQYIEGC